jgi:hypothetical protein
VNGHRELVCACGHGTQERDAWRDPDGTPLASASRAAARVVEASRCFPAAGEEPRAVRADAARRSAERFGSPARQPAHVPRPHGIRYGKKRWVRGEGAHGVLKSHYRLNARRRYRSKAAVELETNIVFAIIVSLAIQQRERTNLPPAVKSRDVV